MKKQLTTDFQTRLWEAVKAVEQDSQVEVVVVLRAHSGDYASIPLAWGIIAAWITHTYMMYAPDFFDNWLVYYMPLLAFLLSFGTAHFPTIKRISSRKSTMQKNVEIMARALFQKGGIHHTRAKTGLLIYCSYLEKSVYLLPDRGVEIAVPNEDWQHLRRDFQTIFTGKQPNEALLTELNKSGSLFSHYLPAQPHDINELPDNLEIDL